MNLSQTWIGVNKNVKIRAGLHYLLLAGILCVAAAVRLYNIHLPGPYSDEIMFSNAARHFLEQDPLGLPGITFYNIWFPLSFSPNSGALALYMEALFTVLSGGIPFIYRYINIGYAIIAITIAYFLGVRMFGKWYGLLIALILSLMPTFVFYSRVGNHVIFFRVVIGAAFLYSLIQWLKTTEVKYFYWLSFILGIGLSSRMETTVWLGVGLLSLVILDGRCRVQFLKLVIVPKQFFVSFVLFLSGAILFVINNVANNFLLFRHVSSNASVSLYGHDNTDVFNNFLKRAQHLLSLFKGNDFPEYGVAVSNPVWPIILVFCLGFVAYLCFRPIQHEAESLLGRRLFIFSLPILLVSTYSVSTIRPMHLLFIVYLPIIMILLTLHALRPYILLDRIFLGVLLVAIAVDATNLVKYHQNLEATEGTGFWSTGIYNLIDHADKELSDHRILLGNWGLYHPLDYFSAHELDIEEIFGYENGFASVPDSFFQAVERELSSEQETVFIFYAPGFERGFMRREVFVEYLEKNDVTYDVEYISDQHGGEMFYLYFPGRMTIGYDVMTRSIQLYALYPPRIVQGDKPNLQPNGKAALAVRAKLRLGESYSIVFDGKIKKTASDGKNILTTFLEDTDIDRPAKHEVFVINSERTQRSNPLIFIVDER